MNPPFAPTVRGPGCPPTLPSDHWYGGLGVRLGDSEAWKPPKVGGCGWTGCPRNSLLSHVAQDTARSWFRGAGAHYAVFGAFWRLFGPFLGHKKGAKKPQKLRNVHQHPETKNGPYLGLRGSKANSEGTQSIRNPPLLVVSKPRNRPNGRLDPRTSGHLVELEGSPARARWGPTVGSPGSPGRKKLFFPKMLLDHFGCSNKCF